MRKLDVASCLSSDYKRKRSWKLTLLWPNWLRHCTLLGTITETRVQIPSEALNKASPDCGYNMHTRMTICLMPLIKGFSFLFCLTSCGQNKKKEQHNN